jgi:AcrR family transcriptional regulator
MASRGRRPAGSGTREAIVEEARRQFGERGYTGTTLRGVATGAGVDPKLVLHYFGSKQGLFAQSVELPLQPDVVLGRVFNGSADGMAQRAAEMVVSILESEDGRRAFTGLLRAAASEPEAAEAIREVLTARLLVPIAERVGGELPELRASLMASQIVGLAMARHIVAIPALAGASREQLVRALVPVLDHYLRGDWVLTADNAAMAVTEPG